MHCELEPIVSLNVGGQKFTTSRETLCKVPNAVHCLPLSRLVASVDKQFASEADVLRRAACRACDHFLTPHWQPRTLNVWSL